MPKARLILVNLGVLLFAVVAALLIGEVGARFVLNPSDYLSVDMVKDDILGAVPSATAKAGFDAWGFRNRSVPQAADIVAVGDSHTFGNMARMDESWPYVLARLSGHTVYNMGMGGYGPNQYLYLSKTKALQLRPKLIIWGLYLGDDFENAFSITYGLNYWSYLRQLPPQNVDPGIWEPQATDNWGKKARAWFSRHSLVYQLVFRTGLGKRVKAEVQLRNAAQLYPGLATSLYVPDREILEAFRPKSMLARLDQGNPDIREGMRLTFQLIHDMNELCQQNNVQFLIVVIPIKEAVFSDYLEHNSQLPLHDVLDSLLPNERAAQAATFKFLNDSKIPYVDPLPAMKNAMQDKLYARTATDMHPGKNGYRVIAEAVVRAMQQKSMLNTPTDRKSSANPPRMPKGLRSRQTVPVA